METRDHLHRSVVDRFVEDDVELEHEVIRFEYRFETLEAEGHRYAIGHDVEVPILLGEHAEDAGLHRLCFHGRHDTVHVRVNLIEEETAGEGIEFPNPWQGR